MEERHNSFDETIRVLGIGKHCRGVMYIKQVILGEKELKELNDEEVNLVIDAWDSRNYIPENLFYKLTRKVKPKRDKAESEVAFNRRFANNIINCFKQNA